MNFLRNFKNSFYNTKEYKSMIAQPSGKRVLHVSLISLVIGVIFSVFMGIILLSSFNAFKEVYEIVPYFEIINAELFVEDIDPEGYVLEAGEESFMLVKPTETTESYLHSMEDFTGYTECILILKDGIIKKDGVQTRVINFKGGLLENFNKDDGWELIESIKGAFPIIGLIGLLIIFLILAIMYIFYAFITSIIGFLINLMLKAPLSYGDIWRCAIYIQGAVFIILCILLIFPFNINLFYGSAILGGIYMLVVLKEFKEEKCDKLIEL